MQFSRDGEFGVLATNFDQFLSQLYLLGADAWQLSKYVSKVDFRRYQGDFSPVTKGAVQQSHKRAILKQEEIQEHIDTVKADFGGLNTLNWLTENEIPPIQPAELFDRVLDTYLASPNLQDFLEKRGGE